VEYSTRVTVAWYQKDWERTRAFRAALASHHSVPNCDTPSAFRCVSYMQFLWLRGMMGRAENWLRQTDMTVWCIWYHFIWIFSTTAYMQSALYSIARQSVRPSHERVSKKVPLSCCGISFIQKCWRGELLPEGGRKKRVGGETSYFLASHASIQKRYEIRPKLLLITNTKLHSLHVCAFDLGWPWIVVSSNFLAISPDFSDLRGNNG